jgi:DNA-directed RNA polymerase subunit RPC12/RpoP
MAQPELMRVVEVAHPAEAAFTNGHDALSSTFDGREYDEDYDNEDASAADPAADEGDAEGGEEYDEDEYDPEAEAEAVARELGNQIWAELGQSLGPSDTILGSGAVSESVQAAVEPDQTTPDDANVHTNPSPDEPSHGASTPLPSELSPHLSMYPQAGLFLGPSSSPTPDPMIETIKTMLSLALSDPHVHYALMATIVPGPVANGANLYTILTRSVMEGRVNPELAQPLSILISALASGSMMMSAEPPQYAPPPESLTSPLKRKREAADDGQVWPPHPVYNPAVHPMHAPQPVKPQPSEELVIRLQTATSDILRVLDPLLANGEPLHESSVMSVQRQLHQVYAFVSTCPQQNLGDSAAANTLQEIGGLIQVVGILSGVPIAQSVDGVTHTDAGPSTDSSRGGQSSRGSVSTIGTAIYPCSTCSKVFNKLSSLRTHERTHSEGRPYRCEYSGCPASFARNHDLRRHEKSHERQMFR